MYVYFMRACFRAKVNGLTAGFVHWKIGRAKNVERRRQTLQTACPVPLEIYAALRCQSAKHSAEVERSLHELFSEQRLEGEWFDLAISDALALKQLACDWNGIDRIDHELFQANIKKNSYAEWDLPLLSVVPHAALNQERIRYRRLKAEFNRYKIDNPPSGTIDNQPFAWVISPRRWLATV